MKTFSKELSLRSNRYYVRYKSNYKKDDFVFIHKKHHTQRGINIRIKNNMFYEVFKTGTEILIEKDEEYKSFELCILDKAIKKGQLKSEKKQKIYQDINKRSKVRSVEIIKGKGYRDLISHKSLDNIKVYEQPSVLEGKGKDGKKIWSKKEPLCIASVNVIDDKPLCYFRTKGKGNDTAHKIRDILIIKYVLELNVGYEFMSVHTGLKKSRISKIVSSRRRQQHNEMFDILMGL